LDDGRLQVRFAPREPHASAPVISTPTADPLAASSPTGASVSEVPTGAAPLESVGELAQEIREQMSQQYEGPAAMTEGTR
jgi:hypothetical protein